MYDALASLHREDKMSVRVRLYFLTMDTRPDVPMLKQRLLNNLRDFGDDMLRVSGVGEFASSWPLFGNAPPTNYETALQLVAKQGWAFQQHTLSPAEDKLAADTFEAVNKTTPIAPLRWSVAHVPRIDLPTINRFKAIGAGIAVHPFGYLAGGPGAGPPLRTIVDSGIHVGAGSDSAQISTLDPWLMIYYMVTGKNSSGVLVNPGQLLTRTEALRLYTAENGWFLKEENKLGTIEPGKLGDIVVLSDDYLDPAKVPDEAIKKLKSVLTVIDGRSSSTSWPYPGDRSEPAPPLERVIGVSGLSCAAINCIVGSGIFGLPGIAAAMLGPAAVLAYLVCAVLIGLVGLCFAEVGSRVATRRGLYGYATESFGPIVGGVAGTLLWVANSIVPNAAVANLLVDTFTTSSPAGARCAPSVLRRFTRRSPSSTSVARVRAPAVRGARRDQDCPPGAARAAGRSSCTLEPSLDGDAAGRQSARRRRCCFSHSWAWRAG